jgi:hypothetical protein
MNSERKTRVEQHAYRIWEKEGRPHGRDKEHWRQAERDLADWSDAPGSRAAPGASSVAAAPDAAVKAKRKAPVPKAAAQAKSTDATPATSTRAAKPAKATKTKA